jgi:single-strand selective monofunctional uracil DNA glycosylase
VPRPRDSAVAQALISAARQLRRDLERLKFGPPVAVVYNPLSYAWACHEAYLRAYGNAPRRVVFLGMNPGPFGMVQTGVPFGEVEAVRGWLGLQARIEQPKQAHPKRPVNGFDCKRSEVSGQRLWGLFARRFGSPLRFFDQHLVINYCPLAFVEASGRNRTPDKLAAAERAALFSLCDAHLLRVVRILSPEWLIGVGDFAFKRAAEVLAGEPVRLGRILHPSPASPAANRDWAGTATRQLQALGIWT